MRYFIDLCYDGKPYHGWQRQPNAVSVQQTLEEALSTLLRLPMAVVGAGRTDTGVHALQMIAHFDTPAALEAPEQLCYQLNQFLPPSIALRSIRPVEATAHARFDAVSRSYEYRIVQQKAPFQQHTAYQLTTPLDVTAMNAAAELLLSHTDFECFSKSKTDVKTFECNITHARWETTANGLIFTIAANRFLRNMVRAIVGTLIEVGQHKTDLKGMQQILASKDRSAAGYSVPAHGLFLTAVAYPKTIY